MLNIYKQHWKNYTNLKQIGPEKYTSKYISNGITNKELSLFLYQNTLQLYWNNSETNTNSKKQDSPHPYTAPKYGCTTQVAPNIPNDTEITKDENKFLEQMLGALLYYSISIYCTMIVSVNSIAVKKIWHASNHVCCLSNVGLCSNTSRP